MTLTRKQIRFGVLALIGLLAASAVIYDVNRPKWSISATTERKLSTPYRNVISRDYWMEATDSSYPFGEDWKTTAYRAEGRELNAPELGKVRLIAASLQVPGQALQFFDPLGGAIAEDTRNRLTDFESEQDSDLPVLRLYFEGEACQHLGNVWAFDSRTHWRVGVIEARGPPRVDRQVPGFRRGVFQAEHEEIGGILAVTLELSIWHDTSLAILLGLEEDLLEVQGSREGDSAGMFFYSKRAWFQVEHLPGMPNPREITNLFEARFRPMDLQGERSWGDLMTMAGEVAEMRWNEPTAPIGPSLIAGWTVPPSEVLRLDAEGMTTPVGVLKAWHKAQTDFVLYQGTPEDGFLSSREPQPPLHERLWNQIKFW